MSLSQGCREEAREDRLVCQEELVDQPLSRYLFARRRWDRTNPNILSDSSSSVNAFSALDLLGDAESFDGLTTKSDDATPHDAEPTDKPVIVDQRVKKLVVSPTHTTDLEVPFPTVRVTTVRGAKKAASMRLGGWVGTKEGPGKIVYGSFEDGVFQD